MIKIYFLFGLLSLFALNTFAQGHEDSPTLPRQRAMLMAGLWGIMALCTLQKRTYFRNKREGTHPKKSQRTQ